MKEQRMKKIATLLRAAQVQEPDFSKIPKIPYQGQFGHQKVFRSDSNLEFSSKDLDELFFQAANKEWITIPDEARRKNIPELYYLDPGQASAHEKYFGILTEYGFVHTPASAALFNAAVQGSVPRKNFNEIKALQVPPEFKSRFDGPYLHTLDSAAEKMIVEQSVDYLLRSKNNPDLLRRMKVNPSGETEFTSSHSRGLHMTPGSGPVSDEVTRRISLIEKSLVKGLDSYPRLENTVSRFLETLNTRIDALVSEQQNVNRSIRFEGKKSETEDILRQNIYRLILEALKSDLSPLKGTNSYEQDYKVI